MYNVSTFKMFRSIFQHHVINRNKNKKINDKKGKNTKSLLTQFSDKHTYSGGYQARKEIHQCSPYSIAFSKLLVYTKDLGPTCIDFNLGTPRSKIPSHYPIVSHSPCDLSDLNTNSKMKLPSNKQLTPYLTTSVQYTRVSNSTHNPKHVSQKIQERLTKKVLNLHQHRAHVDSKP